MVTGRRAFEGTSQASLLSAILKDHPPPVSSLVSASPLVDRIVLRCLAKDADERFQSAHDLLIALRWAAELDDRPAAITAPDARPIARSSGTRAWMLATAASMAAAALLAWPAMQHLRRTVPQPLVTRLDFVTPETADPFSFALSPDRPHSRIWATTDSEPRLWVRSLDQYGTGQGIPGTEGATQPFWSPDGSAVGFFADGRLKRVDLAGGAPGCLPMRRSRGAAPGAETM